MGALIAIAATEAAKLVGVAIEGFAKGELGVRKFPVHITNHTDSRIVLENSNISYGTFVEPVNDIIPKEHHEIYGVRGGGLGGNSQVVFKLDSQPAMYIGFAVEFAAGIVNITGNEDIVRCTIKGDANLQAQGAWAGGKSITQRAGGYVVQGQWGDTIKFTVRKE